MKTIEIHNEGFVYCKSAFYSVHDVLTANKTYVFNKGINKVIGDIDSGNWAISYMLSMFKNRHKDIIVFEKPIIMVDKREVSLSDFSSSTCYMDLINPFFHNNNSVEKQIKRMLISNKSSLKLDDLKNRFYLKDDLISKKITQQGSEIFQAMAAIGVANNFDVFCFPWMSYNRYRHFYYHLEITFNTLSYYGKIAIVPIGNNKFLTNDTHMEVKS